MNRRALFVGIDHYDTLPTLRSCVRDAQVMERALSTHEDSSPNFAPMRLLSTGHASRVTRPLLLDACRRLFRDFDGEALLYFAGHGKITQYAGYLCTSEAEKDSFGVLMDEVMDIVRGSAARDTVLILDCCHAGDLGNPPGNRSGATLLSSLPENTTILAGARSSESSDETNLHGLFTEAVLDALDGAAADHRGFVTAPAIYAQVECRFSTWEQRPVFKSHATRVPILRRCSALITRDELAELPLLFPNADFKFLMDPEFEPEDEHGNVREPVNQAKVRIAQLFKRYRDAGLLRPTLSGEQLYWTARKNHSVQLTPRGRTNWRLVKEGLQ